MMIDIRFQKYLERNFIDKIEYSVRKYINEERNNIKDTCFLRDVSINSIYSLSDYEDSFLADLYVDAIIKNLEDDYEDGHTEHFFIKVKGKIENINKTFMVIDVDETPHQLERTLRNDFMPYYKETSRYDDKANEFLTKYNPEIFEGKAFDIELVIKRMGLNLEYAQLSLDKSIFGMIVFEDTMIEIYDENCSKIEKKIKKNTIIIDKSSNVWFNTERNGTLFTIVHECVHFYIHKKYFYFQKLINDKKIISICKITGEYDPYEDIKWLEIQANKIASRIIMPDTVVNNTIEEYKTIHSLETNLDYKNLFDYLKNRFGVSTSALKVRLNELGYSKTIGIYEWIDNRYIDPYIANDKLDPGGSYSINLLDFFRLSLTSKDLKEELSREDINYLYIDGHVCINSSKYITRSDGITKLSNYALNHINECCLKFKYTFNTSIKRPKNEELILCRFNNYITPKIMYINQETGKIEDNYNPNEWKKHIESIRSFRTKLTDDFSECLREVISKVGYTQEKVSLYTGLSVSTIERMLSNKEGGIKKKTLMQFCVGLKLPTIISEELFERAGFQLTENDKESIFIREVLKTAYEESIHNVLKAYDEVVKS